ncbi:hypothetical protein B6N60_01742 [Richelia sinica FACHB-800]|uniref:Uncharacterized protein n=1 Tax=Richelia sinica FACHB-800 TaxID=1357546 RepID=A0A975Y4D3_9NOST|nr:hypothetical protein B6N60_01742 [Richelia sinica FACHB-800]
MGSVAQVVQEIVYTVKKQVDRETQEGKQGMALTLLIFQSKNENMVKIDKQ